MLFRKPSGKRLLRGRRMTDYRCFLFRTLRNFRKLVRPPPRRGASRTLALVLLSNLSIAILSMSSPGCFLVFFRKRRKTSQSYGLFPEPPNFFGVFSKLFFRGFRRTVPRGTAPRLGRAPSRAVPDGLRRPSFPKATAKLRAFPEPPKYFPGKFPILT